MTKFYIDKSYNDVIQAGIKTDQAREIYFAFENTTLAQLRDELDEWLAVKEAEHLASNPGSEFFKLSTVLWEITLLMQKQKEVRKHMLKEIITHKKAQK